MRRKSLCDADCPVARTLDVIGDWWSLLIVRDAFDGVSRFSEFQRSLGISKGILAARLKALEEANILTQVSTQESGGRLSYVLTPSGRDLFPVIVGLRQWGEKHAFAAGELHSMLVERATGRPIPPLRLKGSDGAPLDASATEVRPSKGPRGRSKPRIQPAHR